MQSQLTTSHRDCLLIQENYLNLSRITILGKTKVEYSDFIKELSGSEILNIYRLFSEFLFYTNDIIILDVEIFVLLNRPLLDCYKI